MTNHSKNENSGAGRRGGWAGAPAALKLAQEWRCPLIECSAKKKENISKVFYTIMEEILTRPGALPCDVSAPPPRYNFTPGPSYCIPKVSPSCQKQAGGPISADVSRGPFTVRSLASIFGMYHRSFELTGANL